MTESMNCRFFWDFFGPNAQKTAEHFLVHLRGFLDKAALELPNCVQEQAPGHFSVSCDLPELPARATGATEENAADQLGAALRPNRLVDLSKSA
jgi:hypothetical protein